MTPRILPALERLGRLTLNRRGHVSRFVSTPVGRVHVYDAWGHGQLPAVIFIHGIGTAAPPFAPVLARLRHHVRRVVALELPGHGASDQPSRQLTPEVLFEATGAALDHLIEQPSVLVGNSLGGAVAMHYAMERPENVRGLFLVSPAGARIEEHELETLVRNFDIRTSDDARAFAGRIYHREPWFLRLVVHELGPLLTRKVVRELLEGARADHAADEAKLGSLPMPVTLVWGKSERLLPPSALAWFRKYLPPHAKILEPEGFSHSPHLEHPRAVSEHILRFLREL